MEFKTANRTFVKSNNSVRKIYLHYTISLVCLILLTFLVYLISGYHDLIMPLFKSLIISFTMTSILAYIFNIIKKNYSFVDIYIDDNIHIPALIIGLCGVNTNIIVMFGAILVMLLVKKFIKGVNLSSALFGVLVIIGYKYFTHDLVTPLMAIDKVANLATGDILKITGKDIIPYLVGVNYISPILAILAFIYLFHKKSIKYSMVIPFIASFSFIMFIYGMLNNMSFWFVLFQLSCGNIIFYSVFALTDYMRSPTIKEGQIFYGTILGIMSAVLRFVIPEFAVIIAIIIGELCLAGFIDKISYRFKYNRKLYISLIIISISLTIATTLGLALVFKS